MGCWPLFFLFSVYHHTDDLAHDGTLAELLEWLRGSCSNHNAVTAIDMRCVVVLLKFCGLIIHHIRGGPAEERGTRELRRLSGASAPCNRQMCRVVHTSWILTL